MRRRDGHRGGQVLSADLNVSATGVGGPDPEEGRPPGTVWFAAYGPSELETHHRRFSGGPAEVCQAASEEALRLLLDRLDCLPESNSTAS